MYLGKPRMYLGKTIPRSNCLAVGWVNSQIKHMSRETNTKIYLRSASALKYYHFKEGEKEGLHESVSNQILL